MPIMVMAAELCPSKAQGTFYSFTMFLINIGYMAAYKLGGYLTDYYGITSTNFDGIRPLIIVTAVVPSMITIPLIWLLLDKSSKKKKVVLKMNKDD